MDWMSDKQQLYSQRIYKVNIALNEFKQACELEKKVISYNVLNYYNLKNNWAIVSESKWQFNKEIVKNIQAFYQDSEQHYLWKNLFQCLYKLKLNTIDKIINDFKNIIKNHLIASKDYPNIHFQLLNIYHSYPIDLLYIDGIIFRNLRTVNKKFLYATAKMLTEKEYFDTYNIFPYAKMKFFFEKDDCIIKYCSQEEKKDFTGKRHLLESQTQKEGVTEHALFFLYIAPLFIGYSEPGGGSSEFNGRLGDKKYLFTSDNIRESIQAQAKYSLCIPVFDFLKQGKLYGNYYGNLVIPFKKKENMNNFMDKKLDNIFKNLPLLLPK
jgi:hypothetical protein